MVLPVIAAAGARVAATTAARAGASTAARAGARTATRSAVATTRKGVESGGRNIVRARRGASTNASINNINSRPGNPNITRARNSARGSGNGNVSNVRAIGDVNQDDEYAENYTPNTNSQPVHYRIGNFVALILTIVAAMFDLSELALDAAGTMLAGVGVVLGYIKDAISIVFFPVVFWALGAPFWKGRKAKKKIIAMGTAFLISMVPWLGAVMPETTVSVIVTIFLTRVEDKGKSVEGTMDSINKNVVRAKRVASRFIR